MSRSASPLRYPGGKSCLLDVTSYLLRLNGLECGHYAEPFAGGAGLALSLLYGGHVAEIHINDLDPSIWAFWDCILNRTKEFVDKLDEAPVTVEEWLRQRDIYRERDLGNSLTLGFSAFFLNRTNRSGIIAGGGVIGGLDQTGPYKIDCRYNKDELKRRIKRIHRYRDRIHLTTLDAVDFLSHMDTLKQDNALLFIDPPYYKKGSELYANYYKPEDHALLARAVLKLELPWVVTYDDAPEIRALYRDRRQFSFDIQYSIQNKRLGSELLIVSKAMRIPSVIKDRLVNRPQYRAA